MPKDLKDQLSNWADKNDTPLPTSKPLTPKQKRLAAVEAAAKKRAEDAQAAADREANLDDSDLFARAVDGIQGRSEAILSKYDATPSKGADRAEKASGKSGEKGESDVDTRARVDPDATLFLDAVSDIPEHKRPKSDRD